MNEVIDLGGRYGYNHKLKHVEGNLWQFEADPKSCGTYRCIGWVGEYAPGIEIEAFDPEGGPYMSVGSSVGGKKIKSIRSNGIFELE